MIIFLDTGVLGLVASPGDKQEASQAKEWLFSLLAKGIDLVSSDICDYEVRRGTFLTISQKSRQQGLQNLDDLNNLIDMLPVSQSILRDASQLWTETKRLGLPTAEVENIDIDIDVIIGATCQLIEAEYLGQRLIVATTNVKHLSRFVEAQNWFNISF